LKSFITNRRNSLAQQLSSFCTVDIIEENLSANPDIYPNPSVNQISFNNISKQEFYFITDITGKICQEGNLQNGKNEINLSTLPKGIYFFNVKNGNIGVTKTEKLIKL